MKSAIDLDWVLYENEVEPGVGYSGDCQVDLLRKGAGMMGIEVFDREACEVLAMFNDDIECLKPVENIVCGVNLFNVLRLSRYEIRHSNMLAWLLDPNENHGLGDRLLRGVLREINEQIQLQDYSSFAVKREWHQIDILAVSFSEKIVLCIENKIDSDEHDDQLNRYQKCLDTYYPDYKKNLVYLTPNGRASSIPEKWQTMNYKTIYDLIAEGKDQVVLHPDVDMIIRHYLETIRRDILKDNEDIRKICADIYNKHKKALDLIFENRPSLFIDGGSKEKLEEKEGYFVYQIQRGDTLSRIANTYKTTKERIVASNTTVRDDDNITAGYYLYIPNEQHDKET